PATPQLRFEDAIGGVDNASQARTGGPFIDRPPFSGLGFVPVEGHLVPLYWLVHSRVPAGSELVRVHADGRQQLLARYLDVAQGWESVSAPVGPPRAPISRFVGPMAQWRGAYLSADPLGEELVVLAADAAPEGLGFAQTPSGRW